MGAKGTNLPPDGVKKYLNQAGKGPNEWPPKSWGTEQDGTTKTCEPTNPSNLAEDHVMPHIGVKGLAGTQIYNSPPLSYLYKGDTQGLASDGAGGLMNRFDLRDGECVGSNKVLVFVTGAAVAAGDIPLPGCVETFEWPNQIYTEFERDKNQYLSSSIADGTAFHNDNYTVSAWIRPSVLSAPVPSGDTNQYIVMTTSASSDIVWTGGGPKYNKKFCSSGESGEFPYCVHPRELNYGPWTMLVSGTKLAVIIADPTWGPPYNLSAHTKTYQTTVSLVVDTWTNTAFTWNSSSQELTLYINGVSQSVNKIKDADIDSQWPQWGNTLVSQQAGADYLTYGYSQAPLAFSGGIDEISVWNVDIPDAGVYEMFSSSQYCGPGPSNLNLQTYSDNLVSWWRMGENGNDNWPNGGIIGGVPDIAVGFAAAADSLNDGFGHDLHVPWWIDPKPIVAGMPPGTNPRFVSTSYLTGALISEGEYIGKCPWIAVSGVFPTVWGWSQMQNIIMLPGARVELTWQPFPLSKSGPSRIPSAGADAYWSTDLMYSGCYGSAGEDCGGCGPKAYLIGAIDDDAPGWPPP